VVTLNRSPLPAPEVKADVVEAMFDRIAPRYDLVNRLMTFGLDIRWRRRAVAALALRQGSLVADLACGTGDFCNELQRAGHRAVGYDFSQRMLDMSRTTAPLHRADILALPLDDASIDGVTCGFALRNVTDIDRCFAEMARVVRPGGRVAILEVATPRNPLVRAAHGLYFRHVVPLIGGLLSDRRAYRYLPSSTAYLPAPDELLARLERAGFTDVRRETLGLGAAQLVLGTRS
jgi:demethylmenaquinone methyltransferase/2-methoxy-6-polyprenyl-1,4-benzoquinol methylase